MYKTKSEKRVKYYDEVIRLHFECGYSEQKIAKILPLGHSTIGNWITNFVHEQELESAMKKNKCYNLDSSIKTVDMEALTKLPVEEQNKLLKAALFNAEMRADAYDKMIDIAENMFKVQIRKKPGAKQ